ncbi:MAG TPA: carbonic anhydrase family protein [Gaiellaceae bacterium]|nr:carbonic anhydrase family protein [Gaiellaceae bacterium]
MGPCAALALTLPLLLAACGGADDRQAQGETADWRYSGDLAPRHWATLDPAYHLCGSGRAQSPINLAGAQHAPVAPLRPAYRRTGFRLLDTGHTLEAEPVAPAGGIALGRTRYRLTEFHFHAPSEHRLAGRRFKLELQLVHRSDDGRVVALAVFIREGRQEGALSGLLREPLPLPEVTGGSSQSAPATLNPVDLLPRSRATYRYTGSLTTPPCTEGIRWIVFRQPIELSRDQILAFVHRYDGINRPLQPLNGRIIALST